MKWMWLAFISVAFAAGYFLGRYSAPVAVLPEPNHTQSVKLTIIPHAAKAKNDFDKDVELLRMASKTCAESCMPSGVQPSVTSAEEPDTYGPVDEETEREYELERSENEGQEP